VRIKVFVQNEAGSNLKHYHDEKTPEFKFTTTVSLPYPFPYGFIIGTTASDGCNLDCYVITDAPLRTGAIVECEPIALMEQFEDGVEDHNILARLTGESADITGETQRTLVHFVENVFRHIDGKQICAGRFLPVSDAEACVTRHADAAQEKQQLG
jgi:inorganic pyrophosphatase